MPPVSGAGGSRSGQVRATHSPWVAQRSLTSCSRTPLPRASAASIARRPFDYCCATPWTTAVEVARRGVVRGPGRGGPSASRPRAAPATCRAKRSGASATTSRRATATLRLRVRLSGSARTTSIRRRRASGAVAPPCWPNSTHARPTTGCSLMTNSASPPSSLDSRTAASCGSPWTSGETASRRRGRDSTATTHRTTSRGWTSYTRESCAIRWRPISAESSPGST
mmetsp:Transcript_35207/g.87730  ORF Transcript_35207/g.87730 Transcript_35207/m.87730 type:complete len:225 (+) Transcript_35207:1662-2336(+)